jgi:hypothetical protein
MNEAATILSDLLNIFHEEELIRLSYRLRRAGKLSSSLALSSELALREAQDNKRPATTQ